jgi:hypothetical protein
MKNLVDYNNSFFLKLKTNHTGCTYTNKNPLTLLSTVPYCRKEAC